MRIIFLLALALTFSCSHSQPKETKTEVPYTGLGKESVSTDAIKQYSPPSLSEEVLTKVKKMMDITTPGVGMVHPNGKQLFFTWRVSGQTHVWRVDAPQGFPHQMTGGKDATMISSITPDGKWLVLTRDEDGQENPGIFLQKPEGGPLIKVFMKPKIRSSVAFVTNDSQWIYFHANDRSPESNAIYRYNIKTQQIETVFDQPGLWYIVDYRKSGELLLAKITGSRWSEYSEFDQKTKKLTPVLGQNEKEEYEVSFSRQPKEFIVRTPKFGNFARLYKLKDGKFSPLTPPFNHDVESFTMDDAKTKIVYQINENGYTKLKAISAADFSELKVPSFPDADHVMAGPMTRDGKKMTLAVIYSKSPRVSYVYDWTTGKLTSWVSASVPEVDVNKFVRAELEYYPTRDGAKIPMFVRRPPQCKNKTCPVIVHFHGGPEGQSIPGFSGYAQLFVDEGFIFAEPNVRGSSGYGKEWIEMDDAEKRLNVITDIEDASKYVKSKWAFDGVTPKVGVMGGSYGGYSTLMAMTYFAGAYDAGVANVGMSNLVTFLQNTAPYRRQLRITEYGSPDTQKDILLKLSPITYIDRISAPLMIIQGANDPRVPVGEAIQIQNALQRKNIPSKLIIFADEGHGSQKKENQVLEIGNTLQFFKEHLIK
jgi:protease II